MAAPDKSSNDLKNSGNNIPSIECSFVSYYFLKNNLLLLPALLYAAYAPKGFGTPIHQDLLAITVVVGQNSAKTKANSSTSHEMMKFSKEDQKIIKKMDLEKVKKKITSMNLDSVLANQVSENALIRWTNHPIDSKVQRIHPDQVGLLLDIKSNHAYLTGKMRLTADNFIETTSLKTTIEIKQMYINLAYEVDKYEELLGFHNFILKNLEKHFTEFEEQCFHDKTIRDRLLELPWLDKKDKQHLQKLKIWTKNFDEQGSLYGKFINSICENYDKQLMIDSEFQKILVQIQSEFALIGTPNLLTKEQVRYYEFVNFLLNQYDLTSEGLHNHKLIYKNAQTNYLLHGERFKKLLTEKIN